MDMVRSQRALGMWSFHRISEKLRQNSQSKTTFKVFAINSTKREKQCLKQKRKQSSWDWVILSSLNVFQSLSNNFAITMESKQRFAYRARLWLWLDFRWGSWNVSHHCLKHFFPELPSIELFRQFLFPSFIVAFQTSSTISLYNFFQLFYAVVWPKMDFPSRHQNNF